MFYKSSFDVYMWVNELHLSENFYNGTGTKPFEHALHLDSVVKTIEYIFKAVLLSRTD